VRQLTNTWQETVGLMTNCTITGAGVDTEHAQLTLSLEDAEGQPFMVVVEGHSKITQKQQFLALQDGLEISAFDPAAD